MAILPTPILFNMRKLTIVINFASDDEVANLTSSDQPVVDLVSSLEASSMGAGSSSSLLSSSHDLSFLPRWTCHPDGTWHQVNNDFDDCDGTDEESKSTANWCQDLVSRWPQKRHISSWST
jgi:hypothetical protein